MSLFFGTDGIRGKVNDDLSFDLAYKCGNALGSKKENAKILIGRDTRKSGSLISLAFASGAMNAGANITDVEICPSSGISYLTKELGYDFGVVISASHSGAEYNGIKIFSATGKKIGTRAEEELERCFLKEKIMPYDKVGEYENNPRLVVKYEEFLAKSISENLGNKTIVLDGANGATYKLAPAVFRDNKARIIGTFCKPNGLEINKDCGSLNIDRLRKYVLKYKADMGFAFDGDGDRVIAVDEQGNVVDGDKILYLIACDYLKQGKLNPCTVVGTRHTNLGIEKELAKKGITLIRTDIGDKYVSQKLSENGLILGGEQSGHIFMRDKQMTGDGILTALTVASICEKEKKKLSEFFGFETYKQANINVYADDKMRIINSEALAKATDEEEKNLNGNGRIMVRVSGTEPMIRVMVETEDEELSQKVATKIAEIIKQINKEFLCAE